MKQIFTAIAILVAGTVLASAQDVKVEKKVEERKRVEERRRDCETKTVEKETPRGDKSITTKRCD